MRRETGALFGGPFVLVYNNNNNININNLILRSQPRQTPNSCMIPLCLWDKRPLCLWDKRSPLHIDLTVKVYECVHTLPPSGFELMTSQEETDVLNH
jgi:hypothetical protein